MHIAYEVIAGGISGITVAVLLLVAILALT